MNALNRQPVSVLFQKQPGAPAIIISPYAKKGYVDHTSYDTTSIIKFITVRFGLEPLPGARATAGDLTAAFDFAR